MFAVIALVFIAVFLWLQNPPGGETFDKNNVRLMTGRLPGEVRQYITVPLDTIEKRAILRRERELVSLGVVAKASDLELLQILKKPDGSSFLYFFRGNQPSSGPTYVVRLDVKAGAITELYILPDA